MNADINPVASINGCIKLPSSKPHMQRSLFLAFLNQKKTTIKNVTWCSETELLFANLIKLGLKVHKHSDEMLVLQGADITTIPQNIQVDAEGSGFIFRVLLAIASLCNGLRIKCNASLYNRDSVLDKNYLEFLSVRVVKHITEQLFIVSRTESVSNNITTDKSSQFLSMSLIIAPFIDKSEVVVQGDVNGVGYIEMTSSMMAQFGYLVHETPIGYSVRKNKDVDVEFSLPTDFTSLGYILSALSSMREKSQVVVQNYINGSTTNEIILLRVFSLLGVNSTVDNGMLYLLRHETISPPLHVIADLGELPSLATLILPSLAHSVPHSELSSLSHVNNHKCQRVFVMLENMKKLGVQTEFLFDDSGRFDGTHLYSPQNLPGGIRLKSYKDHRVCAGNIIMALGCHDKCTVEDVNTLADGFPGFLDVLSQVGVNINLSVH